RMTSSWSIGTNAPAANRCAAPFPQSMTLDQLMMDTSELIQTLMQRFKAPQIYVAGFSFGGTIALWTAARHPELVQAVVGVGPDVQCDEAERMAYEVALEQATRRGNQRAVRELRRLGPPPHLGSKRFDLRAKWVSNFGGVNCHATYTALLLTTLRQLVRSRDYSLADISRTLRGMRFTLDHLLPHLAQLDLLEMLPRLEVPVLLLQGRHDYVAPPATAEQFFQALLAPKGKQLIWFEVSAHNPQYEEAGKFRQSLCAIKQHCEAGGAQRTVGVSGGRGSKRDGEPEGRLVPRSALEPTCP